MRYEFSEECVDRLRIQSADFDSIAYEFVGAYEEYEKLFEEMERI